MAGDTPNDTAGPPSKALSNKRPRPWSENPVIKRLKAGEEVKTYDECTIDNISIRVAMIHNKCILRNVFLESSFCNNSQLFNSTIQSTTLHRSILFNCTWNETIAMKHCQIIDKPLAFRRFPAEIRALIFEGAVEYNSEEAERQRVSGMPPLVVALRGDPLLYSEALAQFYKNNEFTYFGPFGLRAPQVAVERIQSLSIYTKIAAANLSTELRRLKSLRKLHIKVFNNSSLLFRELRWWINDLGTINRLSIEVPDDDVESQIMLGRISKSLGFSSKFMFACQGRVADKAWGFRCIAFPEYGWQKSVGVAESMANRFYVWGTFYVRHIWQAEKGNTLCWTVVDDGEDINRDAANAVSVKNILKTLKLVK